jgi:hypothetical protein
MQRRNGARHGARLAQQLYFAVRRAEGTHGRGARRARVKSNALNLT